MKFSARKAVLSLMLSVCASAFAKEAVTVSVEESVELMSILAHTAGYEEYSMNMGGSYSRNTDTWFGKYADHPAVKLMTDLRNYYGIGFDAVASMAISLECKDGKVSMLPIEDGSLEKRWNDVDLDEFLAQLNAFYTDTHFHDFFEANSGKYRHVIEKCREDVLSGFDESWYDRFYGTESLGTFHIVIGLTNGGGNYGPKRTLKGGPEEPFAIMGYVVDKETDEPDFSYYRGTLIHEFNHSYVNGIIGRYSPKKEKKIAKALFKSSKEVMQKHAYSNGVTVINESVVRAAVNIYLQEHADAKAVQDDMDEQLERGFKWMPELVEALKKYESDRSQYRTLEDFAPELTDVLLKWIRNNK